MDQKVIFTLKVLVTLNMREKQWFTDIWIYSWKEYAIKMFYCYKVKYYVVH